MLAVRDPERNLTLSVVSTEVPLCYNHFGGAKCGPYITSGSETLFWGGGSTWSSGTPEGFVCLPTATSGCGNVLTDTAACFGGAVNVSLFDGGSLELTLTLGTAASYSCSPFTATWNISSGPAYTQGLRSVTIS